MKSHAQHGEDRLAYHYFRRFRETDLRRTFLDIGAYDGVELSNSFLFEKLGWQGICVEANSEVFPRLRASRSCICLNVACSDKEELADYYAQPGLAALGTINPQAAADLNAASPKWNVVARQKIQTMTVDKILETHALPEIDFVSIDVDGSEMEVLRGFDLRRAKPKLVCIETNLPMVAQGKWPRAHADEIHRILTAAGLHLLLVRGCNSLYSSEPLGATGRASLRLRDFASRLASRFS